MGGDNAPHYAKSEKDWVAKLVFAPVGGHDPDWLVRNPGGWQGDFEKLNYKDWDGSPKFVHLQCTYKRSIATGDYGEMLFVVDGYGGTKDLHYLSGDGKTRLSVHIFDVGTDPHYPALAITRHG